MLMETETPCAVPLTASSLAMLESPEYGEDPSLMLLRRMLHTPHHMEDPNVSNDDVRRCSLEFDADAGTRLHPRPDANASLNTTGSFMAYLAPRGASSADAGRLTDMFAAELGNGASHRVGTRGAVAHACDGVETFRNHDDSRVTIFRGVLTNKRELEMEAFEGAASHTEHVTCAQLIHTLYDQCGSSFVDQLQGVFAFCVVDAEVAGGSVFAAVDRRGALPVVKGRCADGGVVIAHVGVGTDAQDVLNMVERMMVGGAALVPAGTYVVGNRLCHPHKYCRSAEAERALQEMRRDEESRAGVELHATMPMERGESTATFESDACRIENSNSNSNSNASRDCDRDRERVVDEAEAMERVASRGSARFHSSPSRGWSAKELDGWDLGEMHAWSSQSADFGAEDDVACESRMGAAFREAEEARVAAAAAERERKKGLKSLRGEGSSISRIGSGASDQSEVKVAAFSHEYQSAVKFQSAGRESLRGLKRSVSRVVTTFDTFEPNASECYVSFRG